MSNTGLIIEQRSRDIGDFLVGRYLPFRKKRMVGPFIFIDHMGPASVRPDHYLDVGQHPHIGLSTLTYLFEGEIHHKDSLGSDKIITPGSVNWMTAGRGVTHTERTPVTLRDGNTYPLHGFQIWVALPKELEQMEGEFHHFEKDELPNWEEDGLKYRLVAGEAFGLKAPVPVYSPLFMIEIKSEKDGVLDIANRVKGEIGICIIEGSINACGEVIEQGNMMVSKTEDVCRVQVTKNTHLLLFGGQPFDERRHIYWNFVSSSQQTIEQAKTDWKNKAFPKVQGDDSYIDMPE